MSKGEQVIETFFKAMLCINHRSPIYAYTSGMYPCDTYYEIRRNHHCWWAEGWRNNSNLPWGKLSNWILLTTMTKTMTGYTRPIVLFSMDLLYIIVPSFQRKAILTMSVQLRTGTKNGVSSLRWGYHSSISHDFWGKFIWRGLVIFRNRACLLK